jgi:hypothetical protein
MKIVLVQNITWRRQPPKDVPGAFYTAPELSFAAPVLLILRSKINNTGAANESILPPKAAKELILQ